MLAAGYPADLVLGLAAHSVEGLPSDLPGGASLEDAARFAELVWLLGEAQRAGILAVRREEGEQGAAVLELRDQAAHKGSVVRRALADAPENALFVGIGDDRTDLDLFRAMPPGGLSFQVGDAPTQATARLPNWREVRRFLEEVIRARGESAAGSG